MSAATYVNPFSGASLVKAERVDQGQDFALNPGDPIRAVGRAKILEIQSDWYQGQPAIFYQLLDGPKAGQILYVGEQIQPNVKVGQIVQAGQPIATYAGSGTGIEYGFGGGGGRTLQQATGGAYSGSGTTPAGEAFSSFLQSLGVNTAGGATSTGPKHVGSCVFRSLGIPGSSVLCKPGEVLQEGAETVHGAAGEALGGAGQAVGEGIVSWIKPAATKISLYAVFIFGAIAMLAFGMEQLLKPVGGPSLAGGARKLRDAAVAA